MRNKPKANKKEVEDETFRIDGIGNAEAVEPIKGPAMKWRKVGTSKVERGVLTSDLPKDVQKFYAGYSRQLKKPVNRAMIKVPIDFARRVMEQEALEEEGSKAR